MKAWLLFWEVSVLVSGCAFAVITVVVSVRGFGDLRSMIADLARGLKEIGHAGPE